MCYFLQAITIAGERRDSDQLTAAQSTELNTILASQLDNIYQKLVKINEDLNFSDN